MESDQKYTTFHRFIRGVIGAVAAFLLLFASTSFYRSTTSSTDENLFQDPPSRFMATSTLANISSSGAIAPEAKSTVADSIRAGDLVLSVNGRRLRRRSQFANLLQKSESDDILKIKFFHPANGGKYTGEIAVSALPDSFIVELPSAVYVFYVQPGGASDLAGMQVGDLITKINGRFFTKSFEADVVMRSAAEGETILYDIIRNGKQVSLLVTIVTFGLRLSALILFLSGLIYWGAGVFIGLSRPNLQAARLLSLAMLGFGFLLMLSSVPRLSLANSFDRFQMILVIWGLPLSIAVWVHSKAFFPFKREELLKKRWLIVFPYAIILVACLPASLLVFGTRLNILVVQVFYYCGLLLMVASNAALHFKYRKQRSIEYRKIRRIIIIAGAFSVLASMGLIGCLAYFQAMQNYGFFGLFWIVFPVAIFYAIGRYQLLDLNLRIGRNIQYSMVMTIWVGLLAGILLRILFALPSMYFDIPNIQWQDNSVVVLDTQPDPQTHDFLERLAIMILALAATFVFWRIGRRGQKLVERLFSRQMYDLNQATGELAEVMAVKLGLDELARGIIEKLAKLMRLKRIGVMFLRDQKVCGCQQVFSFNALQWEELCLQHGQKLVDEIGRFRSESRFSIDYLPFDIKEKFAEHGFKHIIPIRFKNRLVGTFIIGEKLSEAPLHLEDLSFLSAVAKQSSIAIENAFLHEELRGQERMKHELTIARRIQMASLPQKTPMIDGLDIAGTSIPALEVGGDYFDYLNGVNPGLTVIVGDVSGKGTSAALYMSKVQGIIRSLHAFKLSPREIFIRANKLLCQDLEKKAFITALSASIDTSNNQLVLARAGHLPLFYYCAKTKNVELLTPRGLGLGLDPAELFAAEMEEQTIKYQTGDIFLFVTDGITEAHKSNGHEFGEDNLAELLRSISSFGAKIIREKVIEEVKDFVDEGLPHDDQTIVVVKAC